MTELLPCPFCPPDIGDPQYVAFNKGIFDKDVHWKVRCMACGCECGIPESTKEDAAEVWNTRAELACHLIETEGHHEVDGKGWLCSVCGYEFDEYQKATAIFCQSCGAKVVEP